MAGTVRMYVEVVNEETKTTNSYEFHGIEAVDFLTSGSDKAVFLIDGGTLEKLTVMREETHVG